MSQGEEAEIALLFARELARPEELDAFDLPPVDSTDVALVHAEAICRRAGELYGEPVDPPRRVVVVRMGRLYLVHDPFEPVRAGEFEIHVVFDDQWNRLVGIAR